MGLLGLFQNNNKKDDDSWKNNPGTFSKPRALKNKVAWDYMTPDGRKGTLYQSKSGYLMNKKNKKFWKD